MKFFTKIFLTSLVLILTAMPIIVLAQSSNPVGTSLSDQISGTTKELGTGAGYKDIAGTTPEKALPALVGKIIKGFLILLGTLFMVLILYGGYTWMTSFGSQDKVKKAKDLIVDAIIGLAIILAAYIITGFVINALTSATTT